MKKNKFNIGDAIVCINNEGCEFSLKKCKLYTVIYLFNSKTGPTLIIDHQASDEWFQDRFILATKLSKLLYEQT